MLKFSNNISEGLAFDDVLVIPSYSDVLPSEVETSTNFSKNIKLNIPIVSSAMDTVSESSMAISLAREFENAEIFAIDISEDAIKVANNNTKNKNLDERIKLKKTSFGPK